MAPSSALPLYNPALLDDAQFVRTFVARQDQFQRMEARLVETPAEGLTHHYLILGQRGMGKSSLLRRLALAVRDNPLLSDKLIPLTFREEQYNVHNLASFWLNCIDALADLFESLGHEDTAATLDRDAAALRLDPTGRDHAAVLALFQRYARITGRRPILFVDNVDIIFRAIGSDDWALRRELQDPKGMVFVGASAALMEAVVDPQAAFYDFFQIETLDRLRDHEILECLRQMAISRGDTGRSVKETIEKDPVRVQVVTSLTGGNPRTLAILYRILESDISHDVFQDIEYLLDEVTALYKSRVDDLAPQARVVLDAVALAWNPVSAAETAELTQLATSAVSAQLDRLERAGIIEKVPLAETSRQGFQIAERFFNIWYLMRHGPRRRRSQLRWLTEFLRSFYSAKELRSETQRMLQSAIEGGATGYSIFVALSEAIGIDAWSQFICTELRRAPTASLLDASVLDEMPAPVTAADWYEQARLFYNDIQDYGRAEATARKVLELTPDHARACNLIGRCNARSGNFAAAEQMFLAAIDAEPQDWLPYYSLGWFVYRPQLAWDKAEARLRQAHERKADDVELLFGLGYVAARKSDNRAAEDFYRQALAQDEHASGIWNNLAAVLAQDPARINEAIAAWERSVEEDPSQMLTWTILFDNVVLHAPKRAREIADKMSAANPQESGAWRAQAVALSKDHTTLDQAIAAARKAVALQPDEAINFAILGYALREAGAEHMPEAEAAYLEAARRGAIAGWINLFEIVVKNGDEKRLEALAREFIANKPASVATELTLARLAAGLSTCIAKRLLDDGMMREPVSVEDWNERGYYLSYYLERLEEGLVAFGRAFEMAPGDFVTQTNYLVLKALDWGSNERSTGALEANLAKHPLGAQALIRALGHLAEDDAGSAAREFERALKSADVNIYADYEGFFDLFLKTAARRGHGATIIEIFERVGFKDRFWPVAAAFEALVRGEHTLLSVNPEVRASATTIYRRLTLVDGDTEGGKRKRAALRGRRPPSKKR